MGGGASNLSSTDLQSYQESISEVSQSIQNQASNLTSQQVNTEQRINLRVGASPPPENPCATKYLGYYNTCINTQCRGDIPAIYACQIKKGIVTGPASDALCTKAFGYTPEQAADDEGYCSGGDVSSTITDVQLRNICLNKLLRTTCISNNVGNYIYNNPPTSCTSNADCDVGTTCDLDNSICGVRGPSGSLDKICGGNCGTKTIYQIEYIKDGKRRFTLNQIDTIPAGTQCQFNNIPTAEGQSCWRKYNLDDYYDCTQVLNTGTVQKPNCQDICTGFLCTTEMAKIMEPPQPLLDVEGSLCLRNESNTTLSSNQIAEATTTAILTSVVSNQFQNEISKIISQTNSGINFGQENNSQERTSITQKVRTTVRQAIDASSKNMATKNLENVQVIDFLVESGTVRIRSSCRNGDKDCVSALKDSTPSNGCPGGGLILTNSAINKLNDSQTAKSVVDATINSNILNDIRSKYSFSLTQKNENDLLGALLGLLATYFIFILGLLGLGAFIAYKFTGKILNMFTGKNLFFMVVASVIMVIFWVIIALIFWGLRRLDDPSYGFDKAMLFSASTYTNTNPSGQAPQPPPADPNKPGPNEVECKIMNMADCQCSVFVQKVYGETDEKICEPIIGQLSTPHTSISDQCGQLVQRNILWGNNKFTVDYCAITTNPSQQKCSLRSYTDSQTRAICKSPASAPVSTPTASPTMAPKV